MIGAVVNVDSRKMSVWLQIGGNLGILVGLAITWAQRLKQWVFQIDIETCEKCQGLDRRPASMWPVAVLVKVADVGLMFQILSRSPVLDKPNSIPKLRRQRHSYFLVASLSFCLRRRLSARSIIKSGAVIAHGKPSISRASEYFG